MRALLRTLPAEAARLVAQSPAHHANLQYCAGLGSSYADADNACARRATEMDVTMIGLQNAGKTSLLRVLSVGCCDPSSEAFHTDILQGGEFTIE